LIVSPGKFLAPSNSKNFSLLNAATTNSLLRLSISTLDLSLYRSS